MEKVCKRCGKKFIMKQWNQLFCGSKTKKIGCSYKIHIEYITNYNSTKNKDYMREYIKKWMKKQREYDTDYAQRQRKMKRDYAQKIDKKEIIKKWRHKNIKKILEWNRKRLLRTKGVIGTHTNQEWEDLKKYYNFKCAVCGEKESRLKNLWEGTSFNKLTKDHIIPIAKGGTDYIQNIKPLCISCNARKRDKL